MREVAKEKTYSRFYVKPDTKEGEKDLYIFARQRGQAGKDVQQVKVSKDRDGKCAKKRRECAKMEGADECRKSEGGENG